MLKTVNGGYLIKMGVVVGKPRPNLSPYESAFLGPWGLRPFFGFPYLGFAANF